MLTHLTLVQAPAYSGASEARQPGVLEPARSVGTREHIAIGDTERAHARGTKREEQ